MALLLKDVSELPLRPPNVSNYAFPFTRGDIKVTLNRGPREDFVCIRPLADKKFPLDLKMFCSSAFTWFIVIFWLTQANHLMSNCCFCCPPYWKALDAPLIPGLKELFTQKWKIQVLHASCWWKVTVCKTLLELHSEPRLLRSPQQVNKHKPPGEGLLRTPTEKKNGVNTAVSNQCGISGLLEKSHSERSFGTKKCPQTFWRTYRRTQNLRSGHH